MKTLESWENQSVLQAGVLSDDHLTLLKLWPRCGEPLQTRI